MKLIILFLFLLFINLFADSKQHINKDLSHLNLTKEQKKSIKGILQKFRDELKIFREFKDDINEKRRVVFLSEHLNTNELNELNYNLCKKANFLENKVLKKLHYVLTKKQKEKFLDYFDDWKVE